MKKLLALSILVLGCTNQSVSTTETTQSISPISTCPEEVTVVFESLTNTCAVSRFQTELNLQRGGSPCIGYTTVLEDTKNCEQTFDLACPNVGHIIGWVMLEDPETVKGSAQVKFSSGCSDLFTATILE